MKLFINILVLTALFGTTSISFANARCRGDNLYTNTSAEYKAQVAKRVAKIPFHTGLYWEISRGGKTSWILGTNHASDPRVAKIPRLFAKKIRKATIVILEATSNQADQYIKLLEQHSPKTKAPTAPNSSKHFSSAEWQLITNELGAYGIPAATAQYFSLDEIALYVNSPPCEKTNNRFLDAKIEKSARRARIPIGTLDSIQMMVKQELRNPWSDKTISAFIKMELPRLALRRHNIETAIQLYLRGEIGLYYEFTLDQMRSYMPSKYYRLMEREISLKNLKERNHFWMRSLIPALNNGNAVIAFGAGHLPGHHGVLNLLKERGYKITPLKL